MIQGTKSAFPRLIGGEAAGGMALIPATAIARVAQAFDLAAKSGDARHEKLVLGRCGHYIAPLGFVEW